MKRLIIDTDIGTDVDDAVAILYALQSGIEVPLITTVHGDTLLRARIAKQLTALAGYDVAVVAGESKPVRQRQIFSSGLEDTTFAAAVPVDSIPLNAIDAICTTVNKHYGDIAIAAIGPLTNIAKALQQEPAIARGIQHLYFMGGASVHDNRVCYSYRAHNCKVDPEAFDIVIAAGIPTTIITTEVAKQSSLTMNDFAHLAMSGRKEHQYLEKSARSGTAFIGYEVAHLYDPLVIHHILDPHCTTRFTQGHVQVTTRIDASISSHVLHTLQGNEK